MLLWDLGLLALLDGDVDDNDYDENNNNDDAETSQVSWT